MDRAFHRRVLEILAKHDPAGLIKGGQTKYAYASEAEMILSKLHKLRSARGLEKFCQQRFRQQFGRRATSGFKEYGSLAEDIWLAYSRQISVASGERPVSKGL